MPRVFFILALSLSIAAAAAYAQDGQKKEGTTRHRPSMEEMFKSRDKDHNGLLTLDEFLGNAKDNKEHPELAKRLEERFKAMDINKDGSVTLDEMKTYWQKHMQEMAKHRASGRRPPHTTTQKSDTQT